ncbi:MAG: hypothetical protein CMK45_06675 [Porticoccus sp.]|nr:hypothetical protein [Porticoccus sp.]
MQSKKVIHRFIALLLSFFATLALAHPGHGGNGASHDLEHLIWMLGGLVICVVAAVFYARDREKDGRF